MQIMRRRLLSTVADNTKSFALSGCGWLIPFHLGVLDTMKEAGYLTDKSIIAGTSGGSLAAAIACSGVDHKQALEYWIDASQLKSFRSNIHLGMKSSLKSFLPADILQRCNGRLHVCVTKVWPQPKRKVTILNTFDSVDQLLDVIAASCFIPLYSGPAVYAKIDKELFIDGGVFASIPPIGDIRVSPISLPAIMKHRRSHIHIISNKFSTPQLLAWVLLPAPPHILRDLFQEGKKSAELWIRRQHIKKNLSVYVEEAL